MLQAEVKLLLTDNVVLSLFFTGSTSHRMWSTLLLVAGLFLCAESAKHTTTTTPLSTTLSLSDFFRMVFHSEDFNKDGVQSLLEFERLWHLADADGDGSVPLTEYTNAAHFSKFIGREVYKYLDHDHNGVINLQEVPRLFMEFDTNLDGWITEQEFVDENLRIYNFVAKDIGPDKK
ncbi:uncharacterized protein LOC124143606 [Haliotis rufescens]|uniref:uncharacterized protein LOC124143606 n=1 Tax=Haliotis rufescens TaxID=6454 RepID=UPI00201FA655|nr:uncharacterized protein LOC124143606 [Haliotis rufescens]